RVAKNNGILQRGIVEVSGDICRCHRANQKQTLTSDVSTRRNGDNISDGCGASEFDKKLAVTAIRAEAARTGCSTTDLGLRVTPTNAADNTDARILGVSCDQAGDQVVSGIPSISPRVQTASRGRFRRNDVDININTMSARSDYALLAIDGLTTNTKTRSHAGRKRCRGGPSRINNADVAIFRHDIDFDSVLLRGPIH